MEPKTLKTPNISGIEKVTSGKAAKKTFTTGKTANDDKHFWQLFNFQKAKQKDSGLLKKDSEKNLKDFKFTESKKMGSKKVKSEKVKSEKQDKATEGLLASSLLLKTTQQNKTENTSQVMNADKTKLASKSNSVKNIKTQNNNKLLKMKSTADLNPKGEVDIDNKILAKKLAETQKVEAGDTGVKLKQGIAKKEMATTSEIAKNSPQRKGRVLLKGEEKFLQNKSSEENSITKTFSTTDMKETNEGIKQLGLTGYGLKKMSDSGEKKEVEKDNLAVSSIEAGKMSNEIKVDNLKEVAKPQQTQFNYDSIVEQVKDGLKASYNHQLKEMKIKLKPEELGEIEVKFRIENKIMKAEFIVENHTVKEAIESKFNQLKESLLQKGINPSQVNVYVSSGNGDGRQNSKSYHREDLLARSQTRRVQNKINQEVLQNTMETVSKRKNQVDETGVNILV